MVGYTFNFQPKMSASELERVINLSPLRLTRKGPRTRVDLVIALKLVPLPPRGIWQVKDRFIGCCEAQVTLSASDGHFVSQEEGRGVSVARKLEITDGQSSGEDAKAGIKASGMSASLGNSRRQQSEIKDVREWKETRPEVRTLRTKPNMVEWIWYAEQGGPEYIEDDQDLWATAEPETSVEITLGFRAKASARQWGIFNRDRKRIPDQTFLAILAKLLGREEIPPTLLAPAIVEVSPAPKMSG